MGRQNWFGPVGEEHRHVCESAGALPALAGSPRSRGGL